jgi:hypothetical protein
MDVPKELEFKGAGSYWNATGRKRRASPSEKPSVSDRSKPSTVQGDSLQTPIDLGRRSPSESESTSVACERRNIMGPIKENGMAL